MTPRISEQLERLYRRYIASRKRIDYVECIDLAHCLRVWTEVARDIGELGDLANVKRFKCAKPSKKASKLLYRNDAEYIWLCMPIPMYAEILEPGVFIPNDINLPFSRDNLSSESTVASTNPGGPTGIKNYYYGTSVQGFSVKDITVTNFLTLSGFISSQLLFYRFSGETHRFNVGFLIERIANELTDASHFQNLAEKPDNNRLTEALPIIAAVKVGNISLLYFILLYIAQEILISFGKMHRYKVIKNK